MDLMGRLGIALHGLPINYPDDQPSLEDPDKLLWEDTSRVQSPAPEHQRTAMLELLAPALEANGRLDPSIPCSHPSAEVSLHLNQGATPS